MRSPIGETGASIVEVMAAVAIVFISALGVFALFSHLQNSVLRSGHNQLCLARLQFVLSELEGTTVTNETQRYAPLLADRNAPVPPTVDHLKGPTDAHRWPQTPVLAVDSDEPQPYLRNAHLLYSAANRITAIYNTDPAGFCSNSTGAVYTEPTGLFDPVPMRSGNENMEMRVRIQPYQLSSGNIAPDDFSCPPAPLLLRPRGRFDIPAGGTTPGNEFRFPATSHSQYGLMVTLSVRPTVGSSTRSTCSLSKRFAYMPDTSPPYQPLAIVEANNTPKPACSTDATNSVEVRFHLEPLNSAAAVMLCRDQSVQLAPVCVPTGLPPLSPSGVIGLNQWVPCDRVTACGQPATTVVRSWVGTAADQMQYVATWNNLPLNCRVAIQAASVDPAGNMSLPNLASSDVRPPAGTPACGCP